MFGRTPRSQSGHTALACLQSETDLRISQTDHGLGPRATPSYGDSLFT